MTVDDIGHNPVLLGIIITAVASVFSSVIGLATALLLYLNNRKMTRVANDVQAVHVEINSRFSQLLASEGARLRAEGVLEGQAVAPSIEAVQATHLAEQAKADAHELTKTDKSPPVDVDVALGEGGNIAKK